MTFPFPFLNTSGYSAGAGVSASSASHVTDPSIWSDTPKPLKGYTPTTYDNIATVQPLYGNVTPPASTPATTTPVATPVTPGPSLSAPYTVMGVTLPMWGWIAGGLVLFMALRKR